ncbi:MAG: aspartate kinase [Gemmatimonadetes bacterium]|nr:aspartate kinase [Gemmatimonadota bacterium]
MTPVAPTVMKFGGTSVEDAAALARLAAIVAARRAERPVVVVSAMARVTDALVRAVARAGEGDAGGAMAEAAPHLARHGEAARALLPPAEAAEVEAHVRDAEREMGGLLEMIARQPGTRLPLHDAVVSFGERLSSVLVAAVLRANGMAGVAVDARRCIRTDAEFRRAAPLPDETRRCTRAEVLPLLEEGGVPVLGGFIASAPSGATTTLGRGGSDYSAALIGAALDAREIQVWTDVTGFLTADPRVVPGARRIDRLSYAEAAELAFFGAKVLHPRTIAPAVERGIPVRVCNAREPDAGGTRIDAHAEPSPAGAKAIAHKGGITVVQVTAVGMLGVYGFLKALFDVFDRHRTPVDVVATSEVSVSLSVEETDALPALLPELRALGTVDVEEGNAIVCVVGEGLRTTPGIAARVFGTIRDVNVRMISQGASRLNLTFVVKDDQAHEVVSRLHAELFEDR